jgi:imidazolonepropionase-like amidohydrolase
MMKKVNLLCAPLTVALLLAAVSCTTGPEGIAFVAGSLLDSSTMVIVEDSIVLVNGTFVKASGHRSITPLPAAAEKVDLKGKFLVALPSNLFEKDMDSPVTTMEKLTDQATIRRQVIVGIPLDTTTWERHIVALIRAQRTEIVPQLWRLKPGPELETGKRNVKMLISEEIPVIVAPGPSAQKEMALLAECGMDNKQLIRAYLRNANLSAGSDANLAVTPANPLDDWRNLFKQERKMIGGKWVAN